MKGAVLLALCCGAVVGASDVFRANLLVNPSFEDTVSDTATSEPAIAFWERLKNEYGHLPVPGFGRTGVRSFVLRHDDPGYTWKAFGQNVLLRHDDTALQLHFEGYVAGFKLSKPASITLDIEFTDGTALYDRTSFSPTGTFGWTKVSIFVPASKPVRSVYVAGSSISDVATSAFFDDFSLTATSVDLDAVDAADIFKCPPDHVCWGDVPLRMDRDYTTREKKARPTDVTLTTQMTSDRANLLPLMASRWNGPISVALYVNSDEDIEVIDRLYQTSGGVRRWVNVHLVYRSEAMFDYPVNLLRNTAWNFSPTDLVFNVDADFVPCADAMSKVKSARRYIRDANPKLANMDWALIVPAFEFVDEKSAHLVQVGETLTTIGELYGVSAERVSQVSGVVSSGALDPGTWIDMGSLRRRDGRDRRVPLRKDTLQQLIGGGVAQPVHKKKYFQAHRATDFERWYTSSAPYSVAYGYDFEPYMVVSSSVPKYSERFVGYGLDKVSHSWRLNSISNFALFVAPSPFVMHINHKVAKWGDERLQNFTRIYTSWHGYTAATQMEVGAGQNPRRFEHITEEGFPPLITTHDPSQIPPPTHKSAGVLVPVEDMPRPATSRFVRRAARMQRVIQRMEDGSSEDEAESDVDPPLSSRALAQLAQPGSPCAQMAKELFALRKKMDEPCDCGTQVAAAGLAAKADVDAATRLTVEARQQIKKARSTSADLEAKLASAQASLKQSKERAAAMEQQIADRTSWQSALSRLEERVKGTEEEPACSAAVEAESKLEKTRSEYVQALKDVAQLTQKADAAVAAQERVQAELTGAEKMLKTLRSDLGSCKANVTTLAKSVEATERRASRLQGERDEARRELAEALKAASTNWEAHQRRQRDRDADFAGVEWWAGVGAAGCGVAILGWLVLRNKDRRRTQ